MALAAAVLVVAGGATAWMVLRQRPAALAVPAEQPSTPGEITLTGTVSPRDAIAVPSPLEGVLEVLDVPLGGEVLMGQIVARMSNQRLNQENLSAEEQLQTAQQHADNLEALATAARLEAARASAEAAATAGEMERLRAAAERQELLYKEGATSRNAYEAAKKASATAQSEYAILRESARGAEERTKALAADLDAARKAIEERTEALERSAESLRTGEVISPIDGVLVSSKVQPGDDVPAGTTDLVLVAPNAFKLLVALEPDPPTAALFRDGLPAQVTIAEFADAPFYGQLVKTPAGKWEVHFETSELVWRPHQQASVRIRP
jgi:multidrug resistance efflux pump